jgi:hypothetical protein
MTPFPLDTFVEPFENKKGYTLRVLRVSQSA